MTLSNLHPSIADKDLGLEAADIITRNLFQQIENVSERYQPQSSLWEADILQALRLCKGVESASKSAQAYVLAIIEDHWDDMSIDFRRQYDFQYSVLVMRETDVQPSTMDNYTRAARVFYAGDKKPLGLVAVTKYDQFNRPVVKDGEVQKEYVEFDPSRISISKLSVAAPLAKQDKLTPTQWAMLADKQITVEALKKELYKAPEGSDPKDADPSLRYTLDGDRIVAHEFGESVEIAELYFDMGTSDLGRTAIRRLLLALNIPYEEDVIGRLIQKARDRQLTRIYETGGNLLIDTGEE